MSVALVVHFVRFLRRVFVDRVLHGFFSGPAAVDEQQISIELLDSQVTKLLVPGKQGRIISATQVGRTPNRAARLNRYLPM